jgi:hypothetical protein
MIKWVSRLRSRISRLWSADRIAADPEWQKIARLGVIRDSRPKQVCIKPDCKYRNIKLRSLATDLDVHRCRLEFHDGTILDLPVNGLLKGTESKPMAIGGRRLKRVVVQYDASRVARRGRLEIWAQA